jgi:hypothetical protein
MVKTRQPLWIFLICSLLAAKTVLAQTTLTQVRDTVVNSDGSLFNGTVVITWNGSTGSSTSSPLSTSAHIYNGVLSVLLVPTTTASSASFYQAVYYSTSGIVTWSETWQVPPSTTPLPLTAVRTSTTQNPTGSTGSGNSGSGTSTGGQYATLPISINQVTSLGADLSSINSAIASLGMQISSLASSGLAAGTNASFVDSESPAGTLDGVNASFTTSQTPLAGSLAIYRNGLLQTAGVDYSINGSTITFLSGSVPHANDIVTAYYRVPGAGPQANFTDSEVPAGTIDGNNVTFALVNAPAPALGLKLYKNGVLLSQGTDYTLSGSTITFTSATVTPQPGDSLVASYRH